MFLKNRYFISPFSSKKSGTRSWDQETREFASKIGTLSIDNEMHDDDIRNSRRTGSRVSFSARKTSFKQCVVLKRRRLLVR